MGRLSSLEYRRKIFHILLGTTLALLFYYDVATPVVLMGLVGGLCALFLIYLRFKLPYLHQLMLVVERKKHMTLFPGIGAIFFVTGIAAAALLFPKNVATAAILILAWGDGISALLGPFGKIRYVNPKKTWEGLVAGIIAATVIAWVVVPLWLGFAASSVAMLIEGLDLTLSGWKIDDNLLIPVIAGAIMLVL